MITKSHILSEIKRTAKANGNTALGKRQFFAATNIKESDWIGKFWARWSDAVREAGLQPNTLQVPYAEEALLEKLAQLTRELGRFPARTEIQLKAHRDGNFPAFTTFHRIGKKGELLAKLENYCSNQTGYRDIVQILAACSRPDRTSETNESPPSFEYVYLLKSGRFYKIGRSNAVGRREYELAIQLPERADVVHSIKTDDPSGIEDYWHRRFAARRKNGEWF